MLKISLSVISQQAFSDSYELKMYKIATKFVLPIIKLCFFPSDTTYPLCFENIGRLGPHLALRFIEKWGEIVKHVRTYNEKSIPMLVLIRQIYT